DGRLLINEVAPRPHNSGHYTIEACVTSQFENHIRAVAGLPLGDTSLIKPAVMVNILGKEGFTGPAYLEGMREALSVTGVKLHIYGKSHTKPSRKMGHLTVTADTPEEALERADKAVMGLRMISLL
ncbi:MAG: ATP-grasp domain-containing protein, partial [Clostridiales bacterium]|nr:ATP-grasp domain-containing protein [Clostridiales bacterium]